VPVAGCHVVAAVERHLNPASCRASLSVAVPDTVRLVPFARVALLAGLLIVTVGACVSVDGVGMTMRS